jgi:azurin
MKLIAPLSVLILSVLFSTTGCRGEKEAADAPAPPAIKTYELTAGDNMKYSLTEMTAAPGEQIRVTLTNVGTQSKEAMGHNWVLLKKGLDPVAYANAALGAKFTDYQPPSLDSQVIAHIPLLGARQTGEVTFTAPTEPGEYNYLCSFPAHLQSGMHGVLIVK